jgi:hypothetical protein
MLHSSLRTPYIGDRQILRGKRICVIYSLAHFYLEDGTATVRILTSPTVPFTFLPPLLCRAGAEGAAPRIPEALHWRQLRMILGVQMRLAVFVFFSSLLVKHSVARCSTLQAAPTAVDAINNVSVPAPAIAGMKRSRRNSKLAALDVTDSSSSRAVVAPAPAPVALPPPVVEAPPAVLAAEIAITAAVKPALPMETDDPIILSNLVGMFSYFFSSEVSAHCTPSFCLRRHTHFPFVFSVPSLGPRIACIANISLLRVCARFSSIGSLKWRVGIASSLRPCLRPSA